MNEIIVFSTLAAALFFFAWGRFRYDLVALLALLVLTVAGTIPPAKAFLGFGHHAVITVAAVLILSQGIQNSGIIDWLGTRVQNLGSKPTGIVGVLTALVILCSAFMNNIGAIAVFMPLAIHLAQKSGNSPSKILMPLAFASLLGGMTTLIGTPPNLIISEFRQDLTGKPFGLFDYFPVGIGIALLGGVFLTLVGWRLIPQRKSPASAEEMSQIAEYFTEVRVLPQSKLIGVPIAELEKTLGMEAAVIELVRSGNHITGSTQDPLRSDDILCLQVDVKELPGLCSSFGLELVGKHKEIETNKEGNKILVEAVVLPEAGQERTASSVRLRDRFGVNLLAVARRGESIRRRLKNTRFLPGDVLLLQGKPEAIHEAMAELHWLPLARRGLKVEPGLRTAGTLAIFLGALLAVGFGILPASVAFTCAAVLMVISGSLNLEEAYRAVNWPILILLGAMIPVGEALETSGGSERIASVLISFSNSLPAWGSLLLVLLISMCLSDLVNNAAAAVLLAPIAVRTAAGLHASPDPFLMAVAIGASCAFLTPIGHQSNTIVMGPGGYHFGDYWRVGLPLEILIAACSIPLLLWCWPLYG